MGSSHGRISLSHRYAGDLLNLMMTNFGWFERRETHLDIDDAVCDIGLRRDITITLYEIGLARRRALEAPLRNRSCMNAPTLSLICDHSGSSFGSKTTHLVPR